MYYAIWVSICCANTFKNILIVAIAGIAFEKAWWDGMEMLEIFADCTV